MYYECHITLEDPGTEIEAAVIGLKREILSHGRTFSRITGDPILGLGTYCYATKHFQAARKLDLVSMEIGVMAHRLEVKGYKPVRKKVELVLIDSKETE